MDMIYADENGIEIGFLTDFSLDMEIGESNDFEVTFEADKKIMDFGYSIYVNNTEYGGIVSKINVDTSSNKIAYSGQTWRGYLKIILSGPSLNLITKS